MTQTTTDRRGSGTCVLTVHRVVARPTLDHDTSLTSFTGLLDALEARRTTITRDPTATTEGTPRVALTFDDGTEDHPAVGEALAKRGIAGIFFVSAGLVGQSGYIDAAGVRHLAELGHRIASHGLVHQRLDQIGDQIDHELTESRRILESLSGQPVDLYAPVGGIEVAALPERLMRAGYVGARTTRWGVYRDERDRMAIPSIPVTELTVRRGWVDEATRSMELPRRLALLRAVKDALPPGMRTRIRHALSR